MPYGLVYAKEPTAAADKFIRAVKEIRKEDLLRKEPSRTEDGSGIPVGNLT